MVPQKVPFFTIVFFEGNCQIFNLLLCYQIETSNFVNEFMLVDLDFHILGSRKKKKVALLALVVDICPR